ncbi:MAG: DNA primase [Fretibacterium sp.]|nr:DNA primase [Fretibacterium sp.]
MANSDIQLIKERLDIVDVIGDRVRLRRAGRSYVGLCPFHNEKTPSFHVSQEKQNYHCFGCGRGGDIFTFVMETEGLDFPQALELLAARAGVTLTKKAGKKKLEGNLYEVTDLAAQFFSAQLRAPEGAAGRAYMERRALTPQDAARFGLGWSSSSWDSLLRHLREAGVNDRQALAAGLAVEGQRGGLYDRFRGRLMFPIRDIAGRVIAFGGRLVDGEGAKYINSPEGEIYSKRRTLYLLHEARNAIRERGRSILVEGYMDALRLHLCGFTETVASLGTSLTEDQARLLKRFSDRCYICYDSDAAGQEATIRGMYILQSLGLDVQVISLPSGKDPDELLTAASGSADPAARRERLNSFEEAVKNARPLILQHMASVRGMLASPETRRAGVESLMSGLVQLDPSAIAPYVSELAGALELYPHEFWRELEAFRRKGNRTPRPEPAPQKKNDGTGGEKIVLDPLESALCSLLWRDEELRRRVRPEEVLALLDDERVKEVALAILMETPETLEARWLSLGDRWPLALISRGDAFCDELTDPSHAAPQPRGENDSNQARAVSDPNQTRAVSDPNQARAVSDPIWNVVCSALRRRRDEGRLRELDAKMKRGEATAEDLTELRALAAELKRRN